MNRANITVTISTSLVTVVREYPKGENLGKEDGDKARGVEGRGRRGGVCDGDGDDEGEGEGVGVENRERVKEGKEKERRRFWKGGWS